MLRLFIALQLPDPIKRELGRAINELRPQFDGIKWVKPQNMHMTLKFLGDTPEEVVPQIEGVLDKLAENWTRLDVSLDRCGGFPNLKNPRVIWAGLSGADPAGAMAGAIDRALEPLGFAREKKRFSPHLTLGRIKRRGNFGGLEACLRDLQFTTDSLILNRVALIASTLTPQGPIYKDLKVYNLK